MSQAELWKYCLVPYTMPLMDSRKFDPAIQQQVDRYWQTLQGAAGEWTALLESREEEIRQVWCMSDFVANGCSRKPELLRSLLDSDDLNISYSDDTYYIRLGQSLNADMKIEQVAQAFRLFRLREMVRIAWRDLLGNSSINESMHDLSNLADACVRHAVDYQHQLMRQQFGVPRNKKGEEQRLCVFAMGKLGGRELNFSSDIDLIFAYPDEGETDQAHRPLSNQEYFVRLGQAVIKLLNDQIENGFVFRVDMRLRPHGESGPLTLSFAATELYYQQHGREWERYALIKARSIDPHSRGDDLLERIKPFIYRRYLDFSAFQSIRDMKRMISEQVKKKGMQQNIKLGAGGIREVEFIGQAFQLIRGGRITTLQTVSIIPCLQELQNENFLPDYVVKQLLDGYEFLRSVEHRIQEQNDQQSHDLPKDPLKQQRLYLGLGYHSWEEFSAELDQHRENINTHFTQVFTAPQSEQGEKNVMADIWIAVRSGQDGNDLIEQSGLQPVEQIESLLQKFIQSNTYQRAGQQGVERLNTLMPLVLGAIVQANNSSECLKRILDILSAVARRSTYIALLIENPLALSQLVKLCDASSWISTSIARHPSLLDELLDPRSLYAPLDRAKLVKQLAKGRGNLSENDLEEHMEGLRRFKQINTLRVAAADVAGILPLMQVSDYLTNIAEVVVEEGLDLSMEHLLQRHGAPQCEWGKPGFIIVAYGKMGGIELGYGSDLDLVFIHNSDGEQQQTAGPQVVPNGQFFARVAQRLVHILTAQTPGGVLYEADLRLRPNGNSGLLVSNIEAFKEYQEKEAWTWEHQALVRARGVAGTPALMEQFHNVRKEILTQERDADLLKSQVLDMHKRLKKTHLKSDADRFNLKYGEGAILDIEFMVQYQVLKWANRHPYLTQWTDNIRIIQSLAAAGLISGADSELLVEAYQSLRAAAHRRQLDAVPPTVSTQQFDSLSRGVQRVWQQIFTTD